MSQVFITQVNLQSTCPKKNSLVMDFKASTKILTENMYMYGGTWPFEQSQKGGMLLNFERLWPIWASD